MVRAYAGNFDALGFPYTDDLVLHKAKGCEKCNNGYKGRTAIVELLEGTDEVKALIQSRAVVERIREQAAREGMTTLMQDGIRKVCLGVTDIQQVRKVCIK
jgi:type II secretory ATPase GspE/PulE/Tfp pilus assembly ATPase PilB-like protein